MWVGRGRLKTEGTHVYLKLTHVVVQQKPIQAIILQFKIDVKNLQVWFIYSETNIFIPYILYISYICISRNAYISVANTSLKYRTLLSP